MLTYDGIKFSMEAHGGVSVYFRELIRRGVANGLDLSVLLYSAEARGRCEAPVNMQELFCQRKIERYRSCRVPDSARLLHSTYYRWPDRNEVPLVTTVHDFTYEICLNGPPKWVHSWQKNLAIRKAAIVICVSENTRRDLFTYLPDVPKDRVVVIHNGVGDAYFPINANPSPSARPFCLFVGSRVRYKNFALALQAVSALSDFELLCVGGGSFTREEGQLIERLLPKRCRHAGFQSDAELNLLYNLSVCLLYPSAYEGFGIPVLEAMRAGCPVVALNRSSIPEIAGSAGVLLDEESPSEFAAAIDRIKDGEARNLIRHKGLKQAGRFSWQQTFMSTVRVYENLLGVQLLP